MDFDHNEFFRQATFRICGTLDVHSALKRCLSYIKDFIPTDSIQFLYFDPDRNVLKTVGIATFTVDKGLNGEIPWFGGEFRERMMKWDRLKKIYIFNHPDSDPGFNEMHRNSLRNLNFSLVVMRLELENNRLGVALLESKGINRYTEEHAKILLMLHEPFAIAMANALKHQEILALKDTLADDNQYLRQQLHDNVTKEIICADFGLKDTMALVKQVAPLESPVLLLGETGVGKDLIARAIHYASARSKGPLVEVNCGAIPETLLDSELFGHEKGAFTGALMQKKGRFERADNGTIFLDEIGELPLQAQVRLLRVVQNRVIERVGGVHYIPINIRIISATNKNLEEMIRKGEFRKDLWYRLNVFPINIPPLRQRKDDIPTLLNYFIGQKAFKLKVKVPPVISSKTIACLTEYHWPGNVRELENLVERALILHQGKDFDFNQFLYSQVSETIENYACVNKITSLDEMNIRYIRQALSISGGRVHGPGGAADVLGINPSTLRKRMKKFGIISIKKQNSK
ncbi:sigma-54 interaction domain-containing protein [Desulfobacter sp.]|uniref:sigma-54 interaction domain-containing protein n=1 Tax=Desulfobacter sp. TaxID=2294 RepID=UPI003D0C198E